MAKSIARRLAEILEADGDVKVEHLDNADAGLDSAQVTTIAEAAGVVTYSTLDSLPTTGLTAGDQAYVSGNSRLYVSNGSGWYNVALINLSPTMSLDQSGTIVLATDGTATTVTITATDSDNPDSILTFSVESDGSFLGMGTISQDSSVFTITPFSEDSATQTSSTLTFKTTDNINTASDTLSFTLSFSNAVDSSAPTRFLMKATGNNETNSTITFLDSASTETNFTTTGSPGAGTLSPYRDGGYSTYFDGNADRIEMTAISDLSSTNYTIEMWVYAEVDLNSGTYIFMENSDDASSGYLQFYTVSGGTTLRVTERGNGSLATDVTMDFESYRWYHLAVVWDGTNTNIYVDGVSKGSSTNNAITDAGNGLTVNGDGAGNYEWPGYIRDFRISTTARYTSNFTPPTEALTADGDTDVLLCHAPYVADGSTNGRAITISNNVRTKPFGPYDYAAWTADVGGSVNLPTTGTITADDYLGVSDFGADDFTMEGWFRSDNTAQYQYLFSLRATNTYRLIAFLNNNIIQVYASTTGSSWTYSDTNCGTVREGEWFHWAIVRDGTNLRSYLNGAQQDIATTLSTNSLAAPTAFYVGSDQSGNGHGGDIADVRVVKGTAVYTSSFTPPTAPLTAVTNTKLLMQGKTDANMYDAAAANTFEVNSGAQSSTAERKFTTSSSILINGTDDRVTVPNLGIGGDMTFEGWFMQTTAQSTSYRTLLEASTYTGSTPFGLFTYNTQVQLWGIQNGVQITGSFSQNTWHHVAVVRNSGTWTLYIDGTSQGTNTNNGTYSFADTTEWNLGAQGSNASDFIGYLQDWRFSDRAVYTANFTAPTTEFEL